MNKALSERALQFALQRVEDFARVNYVRSDNDRVEASALWMEYVGLDGDLLDQVYAWLDGFYGEGDWDGTVLVGLMLGLLVNEYNHGRP